MIYFDNAATTLRKPDCVIQAVVVKKVMTSFSVFLIMAKPFQ